VQTQGSLQESDLASLLQTMQSERATGTLHLDAGEQSCSLFFLFGHLFHATGPDGDGEGVVIRALSWTDGNYHFDRRAKLVARETVTSSPAELIAAAEEAERAAAAAGGFASATPSLDTIEGQAGGVGDGGGGTPDSSAPWTALENEARDPGRSGQQLAGQREPPLFPSPSRTARRSRRQSSDRRRSGSTRP
jgi:Domain of unknown function (DUF4388)